MGDGVWNLASGVWGSEWSDDRIRVWQRTSDNAQPTKHNGLRFEVQPSKFKGQSRGPGDLSSGRMVPGPLQRGGATWPAVAVPGVPASGGPFRHLALSSVAGASIRRGDSGSLEAVPGGAGVGEGGHLAGELVQSEGPRQSRGIRLDADSSRGGPGMGGGGTDPGICAGPVAGRADERTGGGM